MATKSGKIWGETSCITQNPFCELHRIFIHRGGICSKHKHEFKSNVFYVESGKLMIRVWQNDYDLVDTTILYPGDSIEVFPNHYHQFEAIDETIAYELYFPKTIGPDIKRESVGSLNTTPQK